MKPIIYILICIVGFPLYGISQDMAPQNLKVSQEISFGWETKTKTFLFQNKEEKFSIYNFSHQAENYSLDFGFTAKQINATSQFNHFSIHRDIKEIQWRRQLDPNRNYPNPGIYTKNQSCKTYPLIEVKVFNDFSIGI